MIAPKDALEPHSSDQLPASTRVYVEGSQPGVKVPFREIAEVIGRKLGLPVSSVPPDKAGEHFGWIGNFAQLNVPASARLTAQWLGWQPKGPGLIEDLEQGSYFAQ